MFGKWDHLENRPSWKGYRLSKWSLWLKNSKGQKRAKNDSTTTLELFCAKDRWKKHQIFEKWDHFENRPSWKDYKLCKMVSLAQKIKWPKTCEKRFWKNVRVVLCKKLLEKNTIYSRNETILKIGHLAKAIDFAKWLVWVNNSKRQTCEKRFYKHVRVVLCRKPRQKTPNIRKMRQFGKSAILERL